MKPDRQEILELLHRRLSAKRYTHSLNVAVRAASLARLFGANEGKAEFAGLVHDICKDMTHGELLEMIRGAGVEPAREVLASPQLYHAIAGRCYVESELNVSDEEILNAVRYHTTGRAGMGLLEKVVYLADMTSADRDFPEANDVRALSESSLDAGMLFCMRYIIPELVIKNRPICPDTLACYNDALLNAQEGGKA